MLAPSWPNLVILSSNHLHKSKTLSQLTQCPFTGTLFLFLFLGLINILWVLCFPYPCTDWGGLVFRQTWQQVLPWQHFFWFLGLVNIFMGSLLSIPLHRLQLISFSATPGNKCCHGNTFFSISLTYIPVDFVHSKPLHE